MTRQNILSSLLLFLGVGWTISAADRCPMILLLKKDGTLYENRFHGMYRVSRATLISDLGGGCKEGGPVSSVTLHVDPMATHDAVEKLIVVIKKELPADVPVTLTPAR